MGLVKKKFDERKYKMINKNEKLIEVVKYDNVNFEIVERPEVLWVGKVAYASNSTDEPDIGKLLNEYQELISIEKKSLSTQNGMRQSVLIIGAKVVHLAE
jgi:hypothetical protein